MITNTHTHTHTHTLSHAYVATETLMHTRNHHVCMPAHVCTHTHAHVYRKSHAHIQPEPCMHTCAHTLKHTHTHTHICLCTHTNTHTACSLAEISNLADLKTVTAICLPVDDVKYFIIETFSLHR